MSWWCLVVAVVALVAIQWFVDERLREAALQREKTRISPLTVEGTLTPPAGDIAFEYSMVLSIRNERGEETTRQVIGVGALYPDELRTFTLQVEMTEATGTRAKRRH